MLAHQAPTLQMVKHNQTIRRLYSIVPLRLTILWGWRLKG